MRVGDHKATNHGDEMAAITRVTGQLTFETDEGRTTTLVLNKRVLPYQAGAWRKDLMRLIEAAMK